jgi:hypothetical protein
VDVAVWVLVWVVVWLVGGGARSVVLVGRRLGFCVRANHSHTTIFIFLLFAGGFFQYVNWLQGHPLSEQNK